MELRTKLPMEVRGKLSTTPAQAKRMFGYKMNPGAKGVILFKKNGKLFIRSLMPYKMSPNTMKHAHRVGEVSRKWKKLSPTVKEKWNNLAKQNGIRCGLNLFVKENFNG